jgi:hypothetical protein
LHVQQLCAPNLEQNFGNINKSTLDCSLEACEPILHTKRYDISKLCLQHYSGYIERYVDGGIHAQPLLMLH